MLSREVSAYLVIDGPATTDAALFERTIIPHVNPHETPSSQYLFVYFIATGCSILRHRFFTQCRFLITQLGQLAALITQL